MKNVLVLLFTIMLLFSFQIQSQTPPVSQLHGGDETLVTKNVLRGNELWTTLYNDGCVGRKVEEDRPTAALWPASGTIAQQNTYLSRYLLMLGAVVIDTNKQVTKIVSESMGRPGAQKLWDTGDKDPATNDWRTILPLEGFYNPDSNRVAMKSEQFTWPEAWPDIIDPKSPLYSPDGWAGSWNGYFGRDQSNADEEAYFVADDYANDEFAFFPDSTDLQRRGLGFRLHARMLQFENSLVENVLFSIFNIHNIGTHHHDKVVFGLYAHANFGETAELDEGAYDLDYDIAYNYLPSGRLHTGEPSGIVSFTFFESPGNPYDGIDNDNDGKMGAGITITEEMFEPVVYQPDDEVILIDYNTFERTKIQLGTDSVYINFLANTDTIWAGKQLVEIPNDLIDNNLNGLIDENNGTESPLDPTVLEKYLYVGHKAIDYHTGAGLNNPLIDESRNDGIDNDGDWDAFSDDVGRDGKPNTNDIGEGDGVQTLGEPNFEKTDVSEADMIGLTSFLIPPSGFTTMDNDQELMDAVRPGQIERLTVSENPDIVFGSGYFPMKPGDNRTYSMGMMLEYNIVDLFRTKEYAQQAYEADYSFARPPDPPTIIKAIAGNNKVTFYWDSKAEESYDRLTETYDFEGYKIYRSTDPGLNDMRPITDAYGKPRFREPIAQFDMINEYSGLSKSDVQGTRFYLGSNSGLQHYYEDRDVKNGFTYYYVITSYDRGNDSLDIAPSECGYTIVRNEFGPGIKKMSKNVAVVKPAPPSAGYVEASEGEINLVQGTSNSDAQFTIIDEYSVKDNNTYRITFEDTLVPMDIDGDNASDGYFLRTKSFDLYNATERDTILNDYTRVGSGEEIELIDGFKLQLFNKKVLKVDKYNSGWNRMDIHEAFDLEPFRERDGWHRSRSADYEIEIGPMGVDTSTAMEINRRPYPVMPVNFTIRNVSEDKQIDFVLDDRETEEGNGKLSTSKGFRRDVVYFLEKNENDSLVVTWVFRMGYSGDDKENPGLVGDKLTIRLDKPFLSHDVLEFTVNKPKIDQERAKSDLDKIKVVPNPYIVTNEYEVENFYTDGRGPREIQFTHLPSKCTIRIFNVKGQLIRTLEHDQPNLRDGIERWDMLTRDQMDIGFGVFVYHIDAGELGQKVGKFAVIK